MPTTDERTPISDCNRNSPVISRITQPQDRPEGEIWVGSGEFFFVEDFTAGGDPATERVTIPAGMHARLGFSKHGHEHQGYGIQRNSPFLRFNDETQVKMRRGLTPCTFI